MYIFNKKIEFTKILSVVVMIMYISFVYLSIVSYMIHGTYIKIILECSTKLFAILVPSYLLKSSLQNYDKILNNKDEDNDKKVLTFSKWIVIIMFISLILSTSMLYINFIINGIFSEEIFTEISTPFLTVLPSYLIKTTVENKALSKM